MPESVSMWVSALLQSAAETYLLIGFYTVFLGPLRARRGQKYAAISVIALLYCLFLNLVQPNATVRFPCTVAVFFVYALLFEGTILKRLFAVFCDLFLNVFLSVFMLWSLSFICGVPPDALSLDSMLFAIPNALVLITAGFLLYSLGRQRGPHGNMPRSQWAMVLLYPLAAFVVMLSLYRFSLQGEGSVPYALLLTDAVALLVAMLVHFCLMHLLGQQNKTLEQRQLLEQQIQNEQEKAEALLDAYTEQRRMTHEFSNQLGAISGLLRDDRTAQALELITQITPQLYTGTSVVNTHNPLVDTVLSQKYAQARKLNIPVFFQLTNLADIPIQTPDIVVLISNLFDNALEGSATVASPQIQVKIEKSENDFVLSFRNRVERELTISDNLPPASTKAAPGHGMGLQNVIALLKKYGADYTITCKGGWFQFTALLDL